MNEEENICDNFENSIPVNVSDFCTKCETNSWVGSGYEQYCECCPESLPEPEGLPLKDKIPLKNKFKKDPQIARMQKLAGIKRKRG